MKNIVCCLAAIMLMLICVGTVFAQTSEIEKDFTLKPERTVTPPKIDGVLDDPAWQKGPIITGPFMVNHPVYGDVLPQKTEIWLTYDSKNLYLGFYCHDDDPTKIKGTMTKRDNILYEDWIDFDLDPTGNRQTTYEHACNPLGIQADLINSVSGGESSDPDWVWYSAGKIVKDGYIVEMRIPWKNLKYKSGKRVTMNIAFFRSVSYSGTNASWPLIDQKSGYFNSLVPVEFENLENQLRLEALPVLTFSRIRERETPSSWEKNGKSFQAGIDLKYGVTSSSNVELTLNPDFSQVESDQFQVLANQRYPVFYNEKRPFFMDMANQFNLAGLNSNANMYSAVHTRSVVDPSWGLKFTGDLSRFFLGVLAAGDDWPGREGDNEINPHMGKNANFYFGRVKYTVKGDAYIGALYSGREFAGDYNRVIGADTHFRLHGKHSFSLNSLYTFSSDKEITAKSEGGAWTASYDYDQKKLGIDLLYEDYGKEFRMDSAFYQRTGIRKISGSIFPNFYPQWRGFSWLKKISAGIHGSYLYDKFTGRSDNSLLADISLNTLWQGTLELSFSRDSEYWVNRNFVQHNMNLFASIQPSKWLNTHVNIEFGEGIFYDYKTPYLGNKFSFHQCIYLQFGNKLLQHVSYTYQDFHDAGTGKHVFNLNILISRTTFQFNKYLFLRGLLQYDSYQKKIVSDVLASFTLIPGTVVHLGYGSLYERADRENGAWRRNAPGSEYLQMRQSLFCKIGYRFQF